MRQKAGPRGRKALGAGAPRHCEAQMSGEEFVYDETTGEWVSAAEAAANAKAAGQVEVRDSVGNLLADGDSVTLIKDLKVKGTSVTLKRGQMCRNIRLTDDEELIECNVDKVKGLVLRTEFLKKA